MIGQATPGLFINHRLPLLAHYLATLEQRVSVLIWGLITLPADAVSFQSKITSFHETEISQKPETVIVSWISFHLWLSVCHFLDFLLVSAPLTVLGLFNSSILYISITRDLIERAQRKSTVSFSVLPSISTLCGRKKHCIWRLFFLVSLLIESNFASFFHPSPKGENKIDRKWREKKHLCWVQSLTTLRVFLSFF